MKYYISKGCVLKLKEHITGSYPYEGCGVLLGREGFIEDIIPLKNRIAGAGGSRHFQADPLEMIGIEQKAVEEGLEVTGFYHSHPDERAVTSKEDERHMIPGLLYIIATVTSAGTEEIRGYYRSDAGAGIYEAELTGEETGF